MSYENMEKYKRQNVPSIVYPKFRGKLAILSVYKSPSICSWLVNWRLTLRIRNVGREEPESLLYIDACQLMK